MTSEDFADLIERKTTRRVEFDAANIPLYGRPVVYMAMSHDECLYIGMSRNGLARVFGRGHHVLSVIKDQIVKLTVYETPTVRDAEYLETMMIQEFNPKHNTRKYIKPDCQRPDKTFKALTRAGF